MKFQFLIKFIYWQGCCVFVALQHGLVQGDVQQDPAPAQVQTVRDQDERPAALRRLRRPTAQFRFEIPARNFPAVRQVRLVLSG